MEFHVIINPAAAAGRTLKLWRRIKPLFDRVRCTVHFSSLDHDIRTICAQLTAHLQENIGIILIGGDGSMNDAVNGIQDFEHACVGLIPCGSGNDMVRDMDLDKDVTKLVEIMLEGRVRRRMDIGETTIFHPVSFMDHQTKQISDGGPDPFVQRFLVSSGFGYDAAICQQVFLSPAKARLNKIHLGSLIYVLIAVRLILRQKNVPVELELDGKKERIEKVTFLSVHNHCYEGGGFKFCPYADAEDGMLDVCEAFGFHVLSFIRVFLHAYNGSQVKYTDHVGQRRAKVIRMHSDVPLWVHCDGEVYCKTRDVQMRVLDEKLQFLL